MATFKGSNKADLIRGTESADKIQALSGNDLIYGLGGNDTIDAGGGDDLIDPGAGSDTIDGGLGVDTVDYSAWSGSIRYTATGYATDTNGKAKVEELSASGVLMSTDTLSYIENVIATAGNDYLVGGGGDNHIWGGEGDDWIHGGDGADYLYGGAGDDLIDAGNGWDVLDGGPGIDTVFWAWGAPIRVIVDLAAGTITYPGYGAGADLISNIENIRGNWGTKEFYGNDVANIIVGGDGSDLIDGRGGDDTLVGDWGRMFGENYSTTATLDDTIRGGDGNDLLSGDYGNNVLTGGNGADRFVVDVCATGTIITDFADGVDTLELYSGLTIAGWEALDSDGDGLADAQIALLSNGRSIRFDGHAAVPASLADTSAVGFFTTSFAIVELTTWSMADGWGGNSFI